MHAVCVDGVLEFLLNEVEGFVPFDFFEFPGTFLACAKQRFGQTLGIVAHESARYAACACCAVVELGRFNFGDLAIDDICLQIVMLALWRAA